MFLVSRRWLSEALDYLSLKELNPAGQCPFPGPPTNLDLLNHLFELEPHPQRNKAYMDTLLLPVTEHIDYMVVNRQTWRNLEKYFGPGTPIMRYPVRDGLFTEEGETDTLERMSLVYGGTQYGLQWQAGAYYERSLLPVLNGHFFGEGQLKEIIVMKNQHG